MAALIFAYADPAFADETGAVTAGVAGAVGGLAVGGPVGAIVGGVGGVAIGNSITDHRYYGYAYPIIIITTITTRSADRRLGSPSDRTALAQRATRRPPA